MRKPVILLFFFGLTLLASSIVSLTLGPIYDAKYKLYPETIYLSYDLSISGQYGQRWVRLGYLLFAGGMLSMVVTAFIWIRERLTSNKGDSLGLGEKE